MQAYEKHADVAIYPVGGLDDVSVKRISPQPSTLRDESSGKEVLLESNRGDSLNHAVHTHLLGVLRL